MISLIKRGLFSLLIMMASFAAANTKTMSGMPGAACEVCPSQRARAVLPLVRIGILQISMHVAASALWPSGYDPTRVRKNRAQFRRSWEEHPHFEPTRNIFASDGDWWYFNLFAHGLFGSEAYLAGRDLGHSPVVSFLWALLASTTWEYLVEGFYKQPSAIDLFWTPAGGLLIGELRFRAYRLVSTRIARRPLRTVLQVFINPFGKFQDVLMGSEK